MALLKPSTQLFLSLLVLVVILPRFSYAFGAGNIGSTSKIEGINWRHGDIEDTLLTLLISRAAGGKKFTKMDVKRVYFGNWLRDYSQAIDVGTVKAVSAEAIRIVLWILGFLSFGYGTREFEVTTERLGCYRPEEHIDNPKDYADNQDARRYDPRLRGPIDERTELGIDPRTGLKNYIASENIGITTSAGLIRQLFGRSIKLGRNFARNKNNDDLYEALRLLGTGCHCLEDFSAHSNYTELALIEMGERDVFPHVGRDCLLQVEGARNRIYPIVTGTFGGVDFLHSVMGEFTDKASQSEISELEGAIAQSENQGNSSLLQELLDKLPSGLLGGDQKKKADELQANAAAAKMENLNITPKQPEEFTRQLDQLQRQILPILEFHDELMKSINAAIEKIPVLPELLEQISDQVNIFVFSLLAPFVLPLIRQIKAELSTGSSEVIQSSRNQQLNTFKNDREDNPTHSMLSKDHFSNILNEPAGKVASQVLKWAVPQIIGCWDDDRIDVNRTLDRIVNGVFHHPALRDRGEDGARDCRGLMFGVVEKWWRDQSDRERDGLRGQLSREGVENGRNHKEGVNDCGHGSGVPLKIGQNSGGGVLGGITGTYGTSSNSAVEHVSSMASEAAGGGQLGSMVGGLVSGVGASLLGGVFGKKEDKHQSWKEERSDEAHGAYSSSITEAAHKPASHGRDDRYGQAQYSETHYSGGGERQEYSRYEQSGNSGYGYQRSSETHPSESGGFDRRTEERFETGGGRYESRVQSERYDDQGRQQSSHEERYSNDGRRQGGNRHQEEGSYGDYASENRVRNDYGRNEEQSYSRQEYGSSNRRDEYESRGSYGREEPSSGYGRREEYSGGNSYGGGREESYGGGREESYGGGREESYGGGREESYGGGGGEYGSRREEGYGEGGEGYGGRRNEYGQDESEEYGRRREY